MTATTAPRAERPYRTGVVIVTAVLALVALYYFARPDVIGVYSPLRGWRPMTTGSRQAGVHYAASALLLAVIPLLIARWIGGYRLRDLGLGLGRWKHGLCWLAIGIPLAIIGGKIAAAQAGMRAVYPLDPAVSPRLGAFLPYAASAFLYYGAWEVLFRGILLFGLAPRFGAANANVTQSSIAVTAHFGRALNETFSALPGSLVFGFVALRTRSIWYPALIHWTLGITMEWFLLAG